MTDSSDSRIRPSSGGADENGIYAHRGQRASDLSHSLPEGRLLPKKGRILCKIHTE